MAKNIGWRVIGKGKSGWHAGGAVKIYNSTSRTDTSSASYDTSEAQLNKYVGEAENGALVYDASESDMNALIDHVFKGPMLRADLPPGTVLKMMDKDPVQASSTKAGPLDYVSLDIFEANLRKIQGIRFGRVVSGHLEWETC